jgi:hypothetical protein
MNTNCRISCTACVNGAICPNNSQKERNRGLDMGSAICSRKLAKNTLGSTNISHHHNTHNDLQQDIRQKHSSQMNLFDN